MRTASLAVPVKLWALLCVLLGVFLTANTAAIGILLAPALVCLGAQKNFRFLCSCGAFCLLLAALLYLIYRHGLRMVVFSEFHVLMFWRLSPVFIVSWDLITTPPGELSAFLSRLRTPTAAVLGLLVIFRFFPTVKAELRGVMRSMKNRGLTAPAELLRRPAASCEYVLVPLLLRCLQIADQLSVSAVARGAEYPGKRGSYSEKPFRVRDGAWMALWTAATILSCVIGGVQS
jgi:energy-coupling factor transport system permease protein